MIERCQSGEGLVTLLRVGCICVLALTLAGCRHNAPRVLPPIPTAPIALEVAPEPDHPPMIAAAPVPDTMPPPSKPVQPPRTGRRRRPAPAPAKETPPVQVVTPAEPPTLALGSLSSGGDSTPQGQQQAREMIATITKRLDVLPAELANRQKDLVREVRSFLKQAQQALDSSDADGAKNLATKAKLLMDDLEKK